MRLVDTVTCVVCGKKDYQLSKGKSARAQSGVCKEHVGGLNEGETSASSPDGKAPQSQGVSARGSRSAS